MGVFDKYWRTAYINDLSVGSIDVSLNVNPLFTNNGSLGGPLKRWNSAYIRDLSVGSIDISVNFNPSDDARGV